MDKFKEHAATFGSWVWFFICFKLTIYSYHTDSTVFLCLMTILLVSSIKEIMYKMFLKEQAEAEAAKVSAAQLSELTSKV